MKRRLRAPSPAFVVSLVALFVALGGTTYAATSLPANSVGTAQLKNGAVTDKKVAKKLIVYGAKAAVIAGVALNAGHASSADTATTATSATNADHATTADSATNASDLGGLSATNYVQGTTGNINISLGSSNWEPMNSSDPIDVTREMDTQSLVATTPGTYAFRIDAPVVSELYGGPLFFDGIQICYLTNPGNEITEVDVELVNQTSEGEGARFGLVDDTTVRTDGACRDYVPTGHVMINGSAQISIRLVGQWSSAPSALDLGNTTALLDAGGGRSGG